MAMTVRDCAASDRSVLPAAPVAETVRLVAADPAAALIGNRCPEEYTGSRLRAAVRLSLNPIFVVALIALAIVVPVVLAMRLVRRMRPRTGPTAGGVACAPSTDLDPILAVGAWDVAEPAGARARP